MLCAGVCATLALLAATAQPGAAAANSFKAIAVSGAGTVFVGGNGGVLASRDAGRTWRQVLGGHVDVTSLAFAGAQRGWAAGIDVIRGSGVLYGTSDGGKTWQQLGEPPGRPLRVVRFGDASHGLGVAGGSPLDADLSTELGARFHGGKLVATSDGGRTWQIREHPIGVDSACAIGSDVAYVGYEATVLFTDDAAQSVSYVLQPDIDTSGNWISQVACPSRNAVWALLTNDRRSNNARPYIVYRTTDAGAHWSAVLANPAARAMYARVTAAGAPGPYPGPMFAVDSLTAFVLGVDLSGKSGVSIVRTSDGGATWSAPSAVAPLAGAPLALAFADGLHGYVAGRGSSGDVIVATSDGGKSWRQVYPR